MLSRYFLPLFSPQSNSTQTGPSVNSSSSTDLYHCLDVTASLIIIVSFIITRTLLLLPLSSLVLYLGLQRWRQQRSFDTTSHSDIFTYNLSAMEMIPVLGTAVFLYAIFSGNVDVINKAFCSTSIIFLGQMLFHILTCVERYLAVVHPVTYMGLRQSGGARIRNITIVGVWLLSFGWSGVLLLYLPDLPSAPLFCLLTFSTIVLSFCSLRVLCVLIRPGPGEVGGTRERVDQSKQRAFYTMMAITAVLWLWFVDFLICLVLENSQLFSYSVGCLILSLGFWLVLPSSLVLPLLFLHRAGKLNCFSIKTRS